MTPDSIQSEETTFISKLTLFSLDICFIFLRLLQKNKQESKDVKVKKKNAEEESEGDEDSEEESDEDDDEEEESEGDESEEDESDEDDEEEDESDEEDEITTSLTAKKQVRFEGVKELNFELCVIYKQ